MTDTPHHPAWHWATKGIFALVCLIIALILGYLLVYFWIFNDASQIFDTSVLKNQAITVNRAEEAKRKLREEFGAVFSDDQFFDLSDNSKTTTYRASALNAYEPKEVDEGLQDPAYYFYDESGLMYFFDGEEITPLISE